MKQQYYTVIDPDSNEHYHIKTDNIRHWIINTLDLSKKWVTLTGYWTRAKI